MTTKYYPILDKSKTLLTASHLLELGFKLIPEDKNPFENCKMPYYVKNSVLLFFNEGEWNKNSFYIGYGDMRMGVYYAVAFRWIYAVEELYEIYKAVTGTELKK